MIDPISLSMAAIVVLAIGVSLGSRIEARRWRANADDYRRIESRGGLFKVSHDE